MEDSKGRGKMRKVNYEEIYPVISNLLQSWKQGSFYDSEFVAAYILVGLQHQGNWLGGTVQNPFRVTESSCLVVDPIMSRQISTKSIFQIPGLKFAQHELKRLRDYFIKSNKLKVESKEDVDHKITISWLFENFNLSSVPNYVNESIVNWLNGNRPIRMMFHTPTPIELLDMQRKGYRVITVFIEKEQLSMTFKDPYPPYQEKDILKFLFHDLQHMEKFVDPKFYLEQVGFFELTLNIKDIELIKSRNYDKKFYNDFDHAISDMNSCCVHLFGFLKAKWKLAECRRLRRMKKNKESNDNEYQQNKEGNNTNDNDEDVLISEVTYEEQSIFDNEIFKNLIDIWNVNDDNTKLSFYKLCTQESTSKDDIKLIRTFFRDKGCDVLNKNKSQIIIE